MTSRHHSPPRVALYARCSDVKQAERELSVPAQIDACVAEARRRGWQVVETYIDQAESARSARRPQFQAMISDARKKPKAFEHILVWKYSRFARSREDSVLYKAVLKRSGVRLHSLNEPVDDSPAGRMMEGILEVLDQFYSENMAEDVRRGMKKNASLGHWNGRPPLGYKVQRTGTEGSKRSVLVLDPVWEPVVRRIFKLALAGESGNGIAYQLDKEGIRTKRGGRWSGTSVRRILRTETYTGTLLWGVRRGRDQRADDDEVIRIPDAHPAFVSREDFERIEAAISSRSRKSVHPRRIPSKYLFTGLMRCCKCGATMSGQSARNRTCFYYGCSRRMKGGKRMCDQPFLNRDETEKAVLGALTSIVLTPQNIAHILDATREELSRGSEERLSAKKAMEASVGDAQRRLDRLYTALEQGALDLDDLAPRIRSVRMELEELQARQAASRSDEVEIPEFEDDEMRQIVEDLCGLLSSGSFPARKAFLRTWIKEIEATDRNLVVRYTVPPLGPSGSDDGGEGGLSDATPSSEQTFQGGYAGEQTPRANVLPTGTFGLPMGS